MAIVSQAMLLTGISDHCEMMDRMGLDQDSIMIIHMGGTRFCSETRLFVESIP